MGELKQVRGGGKKISRPWPKVAPCLNTTWRRFDEKQRLAASNGFQYIQLIFLVV